MHDHVLFEIGVRFCVCACIFQIEKLQAEKDGLLEAQKLSQAEHERSVKEKADDLRELAKEREAELRKVRARILGFRVPTVPRISCVVSGGIGYTDQSDTEPNWSGNGQCDAVRMCAFN